MDWQLVVVIVMVASATAFLLRRAYVAWKKPRCSDGCATCVHGSNVPKPQPLVQIRPPANKRADTDRPRQ